MSNTPLKLVGREIAPTLPSLFTGTERAVGQPQDPFLPPGYLRAAATFDVGPLARTAPEGMAERRYEAKDDEVLVLELADGSTFITSAAKLKASLRLSRPELIGPEGEILFERLRAEGAAPRGFLGDALGGLVSKVFALVVGESRDAILDAARERLGNALELGVTWAGTKALMWAIESRLDQEPGLYPWHGVRGNLADFGALDRKTLAEAAQRQQPILIFIHGTGSSTLGSFGDLRTGDRDVWLALERQFAGGIFAFEHRTLSESPIENALQLAKLLPKGARISLVSHSRGGLVADLLCLEKFDAFIEHYRSDLPGTGPSGVEAQGATENKAQNVRKGLKDAHAEQRVLLRRLAAELRNKSLVVQRYVRVASPARGTKLASGDFDLFLSGLLTLIGQVPFFFGSPLYSAFKRVVLEIARNRTDPHLVPGIEAMLPDSPMARLLGNAPVRPGIELAVIAGDIEGGNLLQRLGVLLTDFLLFGAVDNDLVVDTAAMLAGIAPQTSQAKALFDRGPEVSHFRYFTNPDTREGLRDWLVADRVDALTLFQALPGQFQNLDTLEQQEGIEAAGERGGAGATDWPVVVVLPGIMGSHLWVDRSDRVWFDPLDIAVGGLSKIAWDKPNVEAEKLFGMFYGELCKHLAKTHRVERFPYDWRQPIDVLAERLGELLDRLMKETQQPIRLLAHSMGGLVVRACIHKRRSVMDALMAREGARFLMLGTPNQGAYSMVENLLGKGDTLRSLARMDIEHDMNEMLSIIAGFRGALQLLPKPGFVDDFQGKPGGGDPDPWLYHAATWKTYQSKVHDFWFGKGQSATPDQKALDAGRWLWDQDEKNSAAALPAAYEAKTVYVFGLAPNTACGIREVAGRLKMVGTTQGDGTVTWASGRIQGIGRYYYLPASHGDLPATRDHFPALSELLIGGTTGALSTAPPMARAAKVQGPLVYDAGPPILDGGEAVARGLMGGPPRTRVTPRPRRRLEVAVKAMDLRFLAQPILLGHYELDPIAGAEAVIDRDLLGGDLTQRYNLGLYAGPRGTATVVLRAPNERGWHRGELSGAVVTGLGPYDGALSPSALTETVRTGVLRYLLQVVDVLGKDDREMPLATLLLGYNSSANLSVGTSVEALTRGVLEANARFHEATRLNIRVATLDIIELYLDTAVTAVYALRQMPTKIETLTRRLGTTLVCRPELYRGQGLRQRLFDSRDQSYWPRLIVTDADRGGADFFPTATEAPTGSGGDDAPVGHTRRRAIAERLRYLYVGQRARAESLAHQRQPGLVEALVRQQIGSALWQENLGRMLFQLMVPHDFKDAARRLDRLVLMVDGYTANLPWELMLADDIANEGENLPLALRAPVVRQLASSRFRRLVRQGTQRCALVVGNPSVEGFASAFPDPRHPQAGDPPALPGAEAEATEVARLLKGLGYQVVAAIGSDQRAVDVLGRLFQQPYRLLHLSAHGIFDQLHRDGRRRSGAVLSDGLLITAAEIAAMETVPELVFLNCCHLGQMDRAEGEARPGDRIPRDGNRLAASVARELIEIGVRCVVVAGWAVNDAGAQLFGQTFYRSLLLDGLPFGEAVFKARRAIWDANREDITWGAFQAYGDPGWLSEPRTTWGGPQALDHRFATPEELVDELASRRAALSRTREQQTERGRAEQGREIQALIQNRCPAGWLALPEVQSALAATWAELGDFEQARKAYLAAIHTEDPAGQVPIGAIAQLAALEARLGDALIAQGEQLRPGACKRDDRPDPAEKPEVSSAPLRRRRSARPKPEAQ